MKKSMIQYEAEFARRKKSKRNGKSKLGRDLFSLLGGVAFGGALIKTKQWLDKGKK